MTKKLAITILCFMVIAITAGWVISKTQKTIIKHQQQTIKIQKEYKKSLEDQIEYVRSLNDAFEKTVDSSAQTWREKITIKSERGKE